MRDHIAKIVSAYIKGNAVASAHLPGLITQIGALISGLHRASPLAAPRPAVPVERSVQPDVVVCLDCGWQGKILCGHINRIHGLSPRAYQQRWGLEANHPLVAPSYSKRRSALARSLWLRHREAAATPATFDAGKKPARRGRPRKSPLGPVGVNSPPPAMEIDRQ